MRHYAQIALVIAALMYLLGGLYLLLAPQSAYPLLSTGPYDPAGAALLTAAVLAFATIFLIAAHDASRVALHVSTVGLLFLGIAGAHQMFIAQTLTRSAVTVMGLIVDLVVAVYLLIALSEAAMRLEAAPPGAVAAAGAPAWPRRTKAPARRPQRRR